MRRRSGGGAVFHDEGNLNYSVIVPNSTHEAFQRKTHAEMVVRALRRLLACGGGGGVKVTAMTVRVNERNDIVMDSADSGGTPLKVSGTAFKLTRGRALHHGTLLYASPNLGNISKMLKSPARDFISAKGVASVRSPVGNLFEITQATQEGGLETESRRAELREKLEGEIMVEFRKMYHAQSGTGEFVEFEVGEKDVQLHDEWGQDISKGMREMMSPEWTFDQTPGFVFSTRPVQGEDNFQPPSSAPGLPEGANVLLRVKNGVIQEVDMSISEEEEPPPSERGKTGSQLHGKKLHEIDDWESLIINRHDASKHPKTNSLVRWLSKMFPPLSKTIHIHPEMDLQHLEIRHESQDEGILKREHSDGITEVEEEGERLVEELDTGSKSRNT